MTTELQFSPTPAWWQSATLEGLSKGITIKGIPNGNFFKESIKLISAFQAHTPAGRNESLDHFLSTVENMQILLDAIQNGIVQPGSIGWGRMVALMNNDDADVRSHSRKLFADKTEDRDEVYKKYQPALKISGDAKNGFLIFQKYCSVCHQVGEQNGMAFGPDLAPIRNRDMQFIMTDILNPNRSIADRYEMWSVQKKAGKKSAA